MSLKGKNRQKLIDIRRKWDIGCRIFVVIYTAVALVIALWASRIWTNVNIVYWIGIAIASSFTIGGILWQLHSSALLREIWRKEELGIKNYKHYKELVEVDRMWAATLFVMAALIFTLIALARSFLEC